MALHELVDARTDGQAGVGAFPQLLAPLFRLVFHLLPTLADLFLQHVPQVQSPLTILFETRTVPLYLRAFDVPLLDFPAVGRIEYLQHHQELSVIILFLIGFHETVHQIFFFVELGLEAGQVLPVEEGDQHLDPAVFDDHDQPLRYLADRPVLHVFLRPVVGDKIRGVVFHVGSEVIEHRVHPLQVDVVRLQVAFLVALDEVRRGQLDRHRVLQADEEVFGHAIGPLQRRIGCRACLDDLPFVSVDVHLHGLGIVAAAAEHALLRQRADDPLLVFAQAAPVFAEEHRRFGIEARFKLIVIMFSFLINLFACHGMCKHRLFSFFC